jgi:formylglycine-generating enzyme required for sulfatase activity
MTYWTGTAWDFVNPGSEGQILTLRNGVPIWSATSPTVFTASAASSSICAGDRTTLTASGAISYVWSPATGLSSTTISNPIANPAVTTTYYVTGTSGSHSSTVNVTVTVTTTKPVVTATATTPTICAGDWTTLTANGATSYVWSPVIGLNSTTIPNPTANPKVTTTYTVTGTTGSCSSAPVNVTVTVTPLLAIVPPSFSMVSIPGGTFTMGSPETEVNRIIYETQHEVTLSAFKMSKYEITNAQYALFLNTKKIGSNGKYEAGTYPTQTLIYATDDGTVDDWGLIYNGCQWVPLAGFENHPVVNVTWYGAYEFGLYAGGRLPTEAEWEYACRGNTTTAFNTGNCLSNLQANYNWSRPQTGCTNSPAYLNKTQAVGSYGANAFGLHDMHGNVIEWCNDWDSDWDPESTPPSQQTNPTGPTTGIYRLCRGGSWFGGASICRSAALCSQPPSWHSYMYGFRLVFVP